MNCKYPAWALCCLCLVAFCVADRNLSLEAAYISQLPVREGWPLLVYPGMHKSYLYSLCVGLHHKGACNNTEIKSVPPERSFPAGFYAKKNFFAAGTEMHRLESAFNFTVGFAFHHILQMPLRRTLRSARLNVEVAEPVVSRYLKLATYQAIYTIVFETGRTAEVSLGRMLVMVPKDHH
ncbi:ORF49 [Ranid herpesvirus 2]|uniref:ORF49 n=1 Tax=Ranid herpesvirus 2 TaxID=389214 RepID=Q14W57_9VIRU|nr:ORF49 [Ranid herpesvirus 2]ABG25692.1 ORF49 [Ranid herpesvirus 2]